MLEKLKMINGYVSIAMLVCIVVGFFNLFTPEINSFIYRRLFYVLVGASFFIQTYFIPNKKLVYALYAASALCVIGAFMPLGTNLETIKTVGLIVGVIITIFNRPKFNG